MALVTTPGASNADSWASLAEFEAFIATRPHTSSVVTSASTAIKEGALIRAAMYLDASPGAWTGSAVTATQSLGWPRNGMSSRNGFPIANTVIPKLLKDIQCEFAVHLIVADSTATNTVVNLGLNRLKAGPVELGFSDKTLLDAESVVLPDSVRYLIPDSWLIAEVDVESEFVFETF